MFQKSENQSPKMQWTRQIRKRPKKAKINNKLIKIWSKKAKIKAKKTVDTVDKKRPKKAKIKGQNSCFNSVDNLNKKKV